MELADVLATLQDLEELENYIKCQVCQQHTKDLGRIKTCGHYSCKNCLKDTDHNCPKCKLFYDSKDVEWNNIVKKTEGILSNLKETLLQAVENVKVPNIEKGDNNFTYQNQTYHVNFVDEQRVNNKGDTPLHIACKRKKVEDLQSLLKKGVDINAQDFAGWVPLHEAIESGSEEIVEILLKNGALVNVPGEEYTTPLHKAVSCQNIKMIKLLLTHGANKDAVDFTGKKPLDYAIEVEKVQELYVKLEAVDRIPNLFCRKKIVPFCYYIESVFKKKLIQHKIKIEENYDSKRVTHFIIRKTHKMSIRILTAMLDGCMIVPQEWIDDYLRNDHFISISTYNFIYLVKLNTSIRLATLNSLLKLPKLFDGINFYIYSHFKPIVIYEMRVSKEALISFITSGGGKVLNRAPTPSTCEKKINYPFHANKFNNKCCNYIIFEEGKSPELMYQMPELKHRSSKWVFDCAINFTIIN